MRLFTAQGDLIDLADELGRGGEGVVCALRTRPALVAKVYHAPVDPARQAKLRWMAAAKRESDAPLHALCAWPLHTLHAVAGGPVRGFTMPRLSACQPVHRIYGPLDRWTLMPDAGWDALVTVARNVAAAFAAVHAAGHCVGDVNQGNVLVGAEGRVRLIDCDSFQIDAAGTLHRCEVGVGHFTPPELQGRASFRDLSRSARHDNFGLALLLFHLLMGGRHPYAGVPRVEAAGGVLEDDIRALRYAYAPDAARRGLTAPPRAIPITLLPPALRAMFVQAFTEPGLAARPSAAQWRAALDALRASLRRCAADPLHAHPPHLQRCPWCALAARGVVHFLPRALRLTRPPPAAELAALWARIEAVAPPPARLLASRSMPHLAHQGAPLAAGQVAGQVAPQGAPRVAPQGAPLLAPRMAQHVAPQVAGQPTQQPTHRPLQRAPHRAPQAVPRVTPQAMPRSTHRPAPRAPLRPTPPPQSVPGRRAAIAWRAAPVLLSIALLAWAPQAWPFVLLVALTGWAMAGSFITLPRFKERARRQRALAHAQQALAQQLSQADADAGRAGFEAIRQRLAQARRVCEARSSPAPTPTPTPIPTLTPTPRRALRLRASRARCWHELQRGPQVLRAFVEAAAQRQRAQQPRLHAARRAVAQAECDLEAFERLIR